MNRRRREPAFFVATMISLGATFAFSHFFIYKNYVVPNLPRWQKVPVGMWAVTLAPPLLVCIAAGWRLRSWRNIMLYGVGAAVLTSAFRYGLAAIREPGYLKAFESPILELPLGILLSADVLITYH